MKMELKERLRVSVPPPPKPARQVKFDVMLNERYVCTMTYKITFPHILTEEEISNYIECERPSLRGKDYNIAFVTGKPVWRH